MKTSKTQTVIVAGGTGNIGIGIVKHFYDNGAKVIVPYRNEAKLGALKSYVDNDDESRLVAIKTDLSSFDTALNLQRELLKWNETIDIAVASLGGWWHGGRLSEVEYKDYNQVMNENVHSHFYFARSIAPLLIKQGSGTYVSINGPGGIYARPGTELIAMAGWMQLKMTEFLNAELRENGAKAYQLIIAGIYTRQFSKPITAEMITPEEIGNHIQKIHNGEIDNRDKVAQTFYRINLPGFKI